MVRMLNARLIWCLEKHNVLSRYQSRFRQNQNTNDQLIRLEIYIRNGLITNHRVVSIFFDLKKSIQHGGTESEKTFTKLELNEIGSIY